MLIAAIVLVLVGVALAAISWRGRVVSRGVFCAHCRFDLAGIDLDDTDAACPECGRPISTDRARIHALRTRSGPRLPIAALLLLTGLTLLGLRIAGGMSSVYSNLPDAVVAAAARYGDTDALDEFVARIDGQRTIAPQTWDAMIAHALDHQGNRAVPWDPAWGDVLAAAASGQMLSDKQLVRYAEQGMDIHFEARDAIHASTRAVPIRLRWTFTRISSRSRRPIPVSVNVGITEFRVDAETVMGAGSTGLGSIHGNGRGATIGTGAIVPRGVIPPAGGSIHGLEAVIDVSAHYQGEPGPGATRTVRRTDSFRAVPDTTRLIEIVRYGPDTEKLADMIQIMDAVLAPTPESAPQGHPAGLLKVDYQLREPSVTISVRVTAVVGDIRVDLGSLVAAAGSGQSRRALRWRPDRRSGADLERAAMIHAALAKRGNIDLEFKTDPDPALNRVGIDRIHAVNLVLRGVPLRTAQDINQVLSIGRTPPIDRSLYRVEPLDAADAP